MGNVIMKAQQIVYGASNVEAALNNLDVAELIELNKRMAAIDEWKANVHEVTYTGPELTINNALALPARSLKTTIEPIQDLHGLPFPYVCGAYKNKLPLTVANVKAANTTGTWTGNKYTINGVVYELIANDDGAITAIKATETASANAPLVLSRNTPLASGNYIYNGCPANGSDTTYRQYATGVTASDTGSGASFTIASETPTFAIMITSGYSIPSGGLIFKPMIRPSTESDASFAPYSNICPISGRTEARVDDVGINLFGIDASRIGKDYDNGNTPERFFQTFALPNGTYIWKMNGSASGMAEVTCGVADAPIPFANINTHTVRDVLTAQSPTRVITITDEYPYAFIGVRKSSGTITLAEIDAVKLQLEEGSTATPYEPYAHSSATIQLGTTVYGADINWDTGVMTVDHVKRILDGDAETNYGFHNFWESSTTWTKYMGRTQRNIGNALEESATSADVVISDTFASTSENGCNSKPSISASHTLEDALYIYFGEDSGLDTTAKQLAWLAQNPVEICYKLATPTTLQLTPTQLQMLKGYNRVSVGDGYATIELKALVLGGDV